MKENQQVENQQAENQRVEQRTAVTERL